MSLSNDSCTNQLSQTARNFLILGCKNYSVSKQNSIMNNFFHCRVFKFRETPCSFFFRDNQVQNILEQSHFIPSPSSNVVFAQNWPANIDNLGVGGFGLVSLIKISFVRNILHLIVGLFMWYLYDLFFIFIFIFIIFTCSFPCFLEYVLLLSDEEC